MKGTGQCLVPREVHYMVSQIRENSSVAMDVEIEDLTMPSRDSGPPR